MELNHFAGGASSSTGLNEAEWRTVESQNSQESADLHGQRERITPRDNGGWAAGWLAADMCGVI